LTVRFSARCPHSGRSNQQSPDPWEYPSLCVRIADDNHRDQLDWFCRSCKLASALCLTSLDLLEFVWTPIVRDAEHFL
jgi:hypothetical protein